MSRTRQGRMPGAGPTSGRRGVRVGRQGKRGRRTLSTRTEQDRRGARCQHDALSRSNVTQGEREKKRRTVVSRSHRPDVHDDRRQVVLDLIDHFFAGTLPGGRVPDSDRCSDPRGCEERRDVDGEGERERGVNLFEVCGMTKRDEKKSANRSFERERKSV